MQGCTPFARSWVAWYAENIRAADVVDVHVGVGEGDVAPRSGDIVDANQGGAEAVRDNGSGV